MKDLTGMKFERLTALKYVGKNKHNRSLWLCQCDCGNTAVVDCTSLSLGRTKSCGCLNDEQRKTGNNRRTHGGCGTRLYRIWKRIHTRCNNPNTNDYQKWYGSKGITVCAEWSNFESFRDWAMTNGYRDDLTIDRIDSNGNYEPSNCRWATSAEQSRNTSQNVNLTYNGETHCLTDWAKLLGISSNVLISRRYKGWSIERMLTQPIRKRKD